MQNYTFCTRRYKIRYWATESIAVAQVWARSGSDLPIAAAVDEGDIRKSRQALIHEAVERATTKIVDSALKRVLRFG